jgi:glycerol dehydrogenase
VAFGLLVQLVLEGAPRSIFDEVLGFSSQVGLPITLADIGLPGLARNRLAPIADRATLPGETIHNEPFDVTAEMVADAVLAADSLGRAWRQNQKRNLS